MSSSPKRLAPLDGRVDRDALWRRLALTKAQVARLTGVSRRQMIYWSARGLLGDPARRTFDGRAIEKVVLIREEMARGRGLAEAAEAAARALDDAEARREAD